MSRIANVKDIGSLSFCVSALFLSCHNVHERSGLTCTSSFVKEETQTKKQNLQIRGWFRAMIYWTR